MGDRMKHNAVLVLMIAVMLSVLLVVTLAGKFPLGPDYSETTKKSFDETYEITKLVTVDSKSGVFAVWNCNSDNEVIRYCTPLYSFVFVTEVYWANKNNDFFVLSHDTGVTPYIYNDGTWMTGYIIQISKSISNEYTATLVTVQDIDGAETLVNYDIANIPKEVFDYLTQ